MSPDELTAAELAAWRASRKHPAHLYGDWMLNHGCVIAGITARARAHIAAGNDERAVRLLERTLPYLEPFSRRSWKRYRGEQLLSRDVPASEHVDNVEAASERHCGKLWSAMPVNDRAHYFRWERGLDRSGPALRPNMPRRRAHPNQRSRSSRRTRRARSPASHADPSDPEPPLDLLDAIVLALGWGRV